ncbi:RidA family protein [Altibacter sp. HG106]|uniref:RidA family protein n=1 Tax=Altibacter sp. HG106 TaxID=3023937 RepID=UPI00234FF92E|nr:RidA family protein [Altibacter sp. HG106]MDC7996059.1 RidA family protein [Altibacter sp. HG106]
MKEVLERHQLAMTDVVKVMVVLKDINDFSAFNDIYVTYFPQRPARTTFAASQLAANANIEIEVVAVRDN